MNIEGKTVKRLEEGYGSVTIHFEDGSELKIQHGLSFQMRLKEN